MRVGLSTARRQRKLAGDAEPRAGGSRRPTSGTARPRRRDTTHDDVGGGAPRAAIGGRAVHVDQRRGQLVRLRSSRRAPSRRRKHGDAASRWRVPARRRERAERAGERDAGSSAGRRAARHRGRSRCGRDRRDGRPRPWPPPAPVPRPRPRAAVATRSASVAVPPCLGPLDDLVDRERRDLEISERGFQVR